MLLYPQLSQKLLISNFRIRIIYTAVSICCYAMIVCMAVYTEAWSISLDIEPHTTISVWSPDSLNASNLQFAFSQSPSPVCEDSSRYDYQWDSTDVFKYTNFQCGTFCSRGRMEKNCAPAADLLQGDNKNMFIPTAMEKTYIGNNGKADTSRYILPLEEHLQINLHYRVSMKTSLSTIDRFWTTSVFEADSVSNSYTHLVDSNNKVFKTIAPSSNGVRMKLSEILYLTGKQSWLDTAQMSLGGNKLDKPGVLPGPAGRISGLSIKVALTCLPESQTTQRFKVKDWDGRVCLLRALPKDASWVRRTTSHYVEDGQVTETTYHGVEIQMGLGSLKVFDILRCISFLTQAYVLSKIPTTLCRFFILHCMGHVSKIYRSLLFKRWNVPQQIVHAVMSIVCFSVLFDNLGSADDGITLKTLQHKLAYGLQDGLDESELHGLAYVCFETALNIENHRFTKEGKHLKKNVLGAMSKRLPSRACLDRTVSRSSSRIADDDGARLKLKEFVMSMNLTDDIPLKHFLHMFDMDRKHGFAEALFADRFIHETRERVKKIRDTNAATSIGTLHSHADELLVEAATGCDESEKGANRIGTVDRRVVEIELEKETGSDRIGLPTSGFKHMQVSEKVQGIEHVHEDLEHRLLEIEMRVEQEVSERLASNEQQLADCLEQVQHLERLCTKMVDALKSFRPTRDEATDHNHMAVVFAPRQVSQLVHPVMIHGGEGQTRDFA